MPMVALEKISKLKSGETREMFPSDCHPKLKLIIMGDLDSDLRHCVGSIPIPFL